MNLATTFAMADYQYKSQASDRGESYKHPVESLSAEYKAFWVLRDYDGVIAAIDKVTGKQLINRE